MCNINLENEMILRKKEEKMISIMMELIDFRNRIMIIGERIRKKENDSI